MNKIIDWFIIGAVGLFIGCVSIVLSLTALLLLILGV